MAKPPLEFMEKYGIDSDEVWEVRAGGTWAIKHVALERVAVEQGITFDPPVIIEAKAADKIAVMCVTGYDKAKRFEWSIGEASPANCKNAYCFAMAEKRAKDRVALKLLNAHGVIYSDVEGEDLAKSEGDGKPAQLAKKDAKEIYSKMQREVQGSVSREQLKLWMKTNTDRIKILPDDWQDTLRLQCEEMLADLRERETV